MKLSDFSYNLPQHLIAQEPLLRRDASRLLVLHRENGQLEDRSFNEITRFISKKDLLVLNDTKVFNARLIGKREGFEGRIELLISHKVDNGLYACLGKPARKLKEGTRLSFGNNRLSAEVVSTDCDFKIIRFITDDLDDILDNIGEVPLPPYIKRSPKEIDKDRYQTVYAKTKGAIAAPTAGLHFSDELLSDIESKGIEALAITLHVGYGTFKPVTDDNIDNHNMHKEFYHISKDAADKINKTKKSGGRVFAVGTTVCRGLESAAIKEKESYFVHPKESETDLFISPGYGFKITDALITNFHLPYTTLLMLVAAFSGKFDILKVYEHAIKKGYRFYSYGDAMLIL